MPLPLSVLVFLGPQVRTNLAHLGFASVEHALAAAHVTGPLLAEYLRIDLAARTRALVLESIPASLCEAMQSAVYALGVPGAPLRAQDPPGVGLGRAAGTAGEREPGGGHAARALPGLARHLRRLRGAGGLRVPRAQAPLVLAVPLRRAAGGLLGVLPRPDRDGPAAVL